MVFEPKNIFGLTGGIGSGKSTAAAAFCKLGIPVINADQVARDVVKPGTPALTAIANHFGAHILQPNGELDRKALRNIIFENPLEKAWLEQLLHPQIRQSITSQLREPTQAPYRLLESPLLLETDQKQLVAGVILVDVSVETQIARASARDQTSAEQIKAIIESQLSRREKLALADFVLSNEGNKTALETQVVQLHDRLVTQAQGR